MIFAWYRRRKVLNISHLKPLILKIETTNTCNARCCFCAYCKSTRPKKILSRELYEKALEGYSAIGGGPITLTPVVGDVLLDPYLLDRLSIVTLFPAITDVSFTTNLIAHEKLSDGEWAGVLRRLRYLQISIGGYDRQTYAKMFGVDAFDIVWGGIHRIASIKKRNGIGTKMAVSLRAPDVSVLLHHDKTSLLKKMGYSNISGISVFGNWCGDITGYDMPLNTKILCPTEKSDCCIMPAMFIAVLSDGRLTGCSCVDHDGLLELGTLQSESLGEVWLGNRRTELCSSFVKGVNNNICTDCSSYRSLHRTSGMPFWRDVNVSHLSTRFYEDFGGG